MSFEAELAGELPDEGWCVRESFPEGQLVDDQIGHLSGGEQRLLRIVASLAGGEPVSLAENVPGLDRELTDLVLAAISHASGSHEHPSIRIDHGRGVAVQDGRLPSLHPWPEPARDSSPTEGSDAH